MTEEEPGVVEIYDVLIFWAPAKGGVRETIRLTQSNAFTNGITFI
jgi:hypothetical protein